MIYQGSCHCGRVAYEVEGDIQGALACNCSMCQRKGSLLWFVPRAQFRLRTPEDAAATSGFLSGILGCLMQEGGICIWISTHRMIFPPALQHFGIAPDQVVFVDVSRDKDALWAMEEALKCNGLAAVVGELKEISFTASRRLQLAVEQSKVTGFVHRHQPRQLTSTTCVARWQITPLVSEQEERMPGPGFPSWQVALLKMRSGKPGTWRLTWYDNRFHTIREAITALPQTPLRKIG